MAVAPVAKQQKESKGVYLLTLADQFAAENGGISEF